MITFVWMKIIFASQNPNKLKEIQSKLSAFEITGLSNATFPDELKETGLTLDENARQKAQQVWDKTQHACFADDTGLEVEALNGAPGVFSARYAGDQKNAEDNMHLLMQNLKGETHRIARFRTVISLCLEGIFYTFEGICEGEIIHEKKGSYGFGYDPIFVPKGSSKTFAEMTLDEKAIISHRALAMDKLVTFLTQR